MDQHVDALGCDGELISQDGERKVGAVQADAYRYFLTRPDAVERVAEFLAWDGRLDLTFAPAGRCHLVSVAPAVR